MKILGLMNVNETFKLNELSENAQRFVLEVLKEKTRDRLVTAQVNSEFTKDLWNKDTELGVRVIRDYGMHAELAYPIYHKDYPQNTEVGYSVVTLGRLYTEQHRIGTDDYYRYIPCVNRFSDDELDDIFKEFVDKLNKDYKIIEDYDAEAIAEAFECGDIDAVEDILMDRDLTEFI